MILQSKIFLNIWQKMKKNIVFLFSILYKLIVLVLWQFERWLSEGWRCSKMRVGKNDRKKFFENFEPDSEPSPKSDSSFFKSSTFLVLCFSDLRMPEKRASSSMREKGNYWMSEKEPKEISEKARAPVWSLLRWSPWHDPAWGESSWSHAKVKQVMSCRQLEDGYSINKSRDWINRKAWNFFAM